MMSFLDKFDMFTDKGLEPGTYSYDGVDDLAGHRFHLRVDSERKGVLIVDASRLLFLNGTALDLARCALEGMDERTASSYMKRRYRHLKREKAREDFRKVMAQLVSFAEGDMDVLNQVGSTQPAIGADDMPSPYRMDLALTYRCQNECGHCYNEEKREVPELSKEVWLDIIDRLWDLGIPHVVFTGGEPTMVPFLPDLIRRSESHGQITGLITNGRNLAEVGYLMSLVQAGLDHVQVTVLSHKESVHDQLAGSEGAWAETVDGLKRALGQNLYVSTNTTIMSENLDDIEDTVRFLIDLGVENVSLNGIIRSGKGKEARSVTYGDLKVLLTRVVSICEKAGVKLTWYTPTPYCELNPLTFGLGIKQCTACSLAMAIEPDGSVLPCQSYYEPLGNIMEDEWEAIWDHQLCKGIRERDYLPEKCGECELAPVCGGGCPLALEHGDYTCLDRMSSM
jgi:radical SAM protein with 4Fe4S-binding SPASM domain